MTFCIAGKLGVGQIKAGDLGYEGLLDKTAWGKTKDYLVKEGVLKRGKGATQIYSSVIDLEGVELVDGFSKLTNFPISKTYSAITDVFSGKPITRDHIAVLMPYGSSHNASGAGEADRILQSLHAPVYSPLLRTLDSAAEDFSVTTSKVILGGALVKYGYMGLNVAAGTKYGQYAIGKTDQALSYAASTKIGQTTTKVVSTTTNWAMELSGKTVKTNKNPTVVTEVSNNIKTKSSSETKRVQDVLGGNGENISTEDYLLQKEAERLLDAYKSGKVKRGGSGSSGVRKLKAPEFHGGKLSESEFLQSALKYLGKDYRSLPNGRYISKDGLRQVRYGRHEVSSKQHHAHFESYDKPNGRIVENTMVEIVKGK